MTSLEILSGYSFDKRGAYFILDSTKRVDRRRIYVSNTKRTLKLQKERHCVGTYDLQTFNTAPCSEMKTLDNTASSNHCPRCTSINGFNPAFYNTSALSPQQRKYNNSPHVTYLAYFSPTLIKVGIASQARMSVRLMEQGALYAIIVGEFNDAYEARKLEKHIKDSTRLSESIKSSVKINNLCEGRYSSELAINSLNDVCTKNNLSYEKHYDLMPHYFKQDNLLLKLPSPLNKYNESDSLISGRLIGLVGDALVFENNGIYFVSSIKKWISHKIELCDEEVSLTPHITQMTLFDF
jgi:hypothetical protein